MKYFTEKHGVCLRCTSADTKDTEKHGEFSQWISAISLCGPLCKKST
jgi:hypothetical protein